MSFHFGGCGCQGLARIATVHIEGTPWPNWKAIYPTFGNDPIFDATQTAYQKTYAAKSAVRTSDDTSYVGTWNQTFNVYTRQISGDGDPPALSNVISGPNNNSDGTIRTTVYYPPLASAPITETVTLSDEYTRTEMDADADAILAGIDWSAIGLEVKRLFYYEPDTGDVVYSDDIISPLPESDEAFQAGSYFYFNGFSSQRAVIKCGVTTLWRIQTFRSEASPWAQFGNFWNGAGLSNPSNLESCSDYTSSICTPHEITVPIPAATITGPGRFTGQNVLGRMKTCAE